MIDYEHMEVGQKAMLPAGKWDDSLREIIAPISEWANLQDPRRQFQVNAENSPLNTSFSLERIK